MNQANFLAHRSLGSGSSPPEYLFKPVFYLLSQGSVFLLQISRSLISPFFTSPVYSSGFLIITLPCYLPVYHFPAYHFPAYHFIAYHFIVVCLTIFPSFALCNLMFDDCYLQCFK